MYTINNYYSNEIVSNLFLKKCFWKNVFENKDIVKSVDLNIPLNKISNQDTKLLKSIIISDLFSNQKSQAILTKRTQDGLEVIISARIKPLHFDFLFVMLSLLYFPGLYRRRESLKQSFLENGSIRLQISELEHFFFKPPLFYQWNKTIQLVFNTSSRYKHWIPAYLSFYNFNFDYNKKLDY